MGTTSVPVLLGDGDNFLAKKWNESDLRISCRLLPGRDDAILEYLAKIGDGEKSYELRKALRAYVQLMTEPTPLTAFPPIKEVCSKGYLNPSAAIRVANQIISSSPPVKLNPDDSEEPSDEDIMAAIGGLLEQF
jgi:hypothetical protein